MSATWVDQPTVEIHPPETWHDLSLDQLLDVKSKLTNKLYLAKGRPEYVRPISLAIARVDALINAKTNNGSGSSMPSIV